MGVLANLARMILIRQRFAFLDVVAGLSISDYRGTEWTGCICGSQWILTPLAFNDDGTVNSYGTDGFCCNCGSMISVPCPTGSND